MEISFKTDAYATLVSSGYSPEDAEKLVAYLNDAGGPTEERLTAGRKLHIAETLSLHWLVDELRKRATSRNSSPEAAVEALKVLADISANVAWGLKL